MSANPPQSNFSKALEGLGLKSSGETVNYEEIGSRLMERARGYGLRISSSKRTPAENRAAGGAKTSHHLYGDALDFAGTPDAMMRFAREAARDYGAHLDELYYDPFGGYRRGQSIGAIGDHHDHVHVAFPGASQFGTASGEEVTDARATLKFSTGAQTDTRTANACRLERRRAGDTGKRSSDGQRTTDQRPRRRAD